MKIAIVGAGCAGLSLAWQLMKHPGAHSIVLVDARNSYRRDRTWCSWNVAPHPFRSLVTHSWKRWRVRAESTWVEREAPGLRYEHIPADAFYDLVRQEIERHEEVELRLGVCVQAMIDHGDRVRIETDERPIEADMVFDSRPIRPLPGTLLQHFEGWFVQTPTARFEPGVATLMDFDVPQDHGMHFVYVLPYADDYALVEATWFSERPGGSAFYRPYLERYLERAMGLGCFEVTGRERGVIPMSAEKRNRSPSPRIHRIGLGGGAAKPSSGYAFQAIQDDSAEIARRLGATSRGETRRFTAPPFRSERARAQDRILLSFLQRYPGRAPAVFASLFEAVPPASLAQFLTDRPSHRDVASVIAAMPLLPMARQALLAFRPC